MHKFVIKLKNFLSESKTFAGISFHGMYSMQDSNFFKALEHFLKTGENTLDEYSSITYLCWEISDKSYGFDFYYYGEEKREKIYKYLNQENYWNIYTFLNDDEIEILKDNLERSESYDEYRKTYKFRRKQACLYTSDPSVRKIIFERDGKICKKCGSIKNLQLDHIIPVSKGGEDVEDNLQVLCKSCNSSKGNKTKQ